MNNSDVIEDHFEGVEFIPEKTEMAVNVALNILDKWSLTDDEKRKVLGLSDKDSLIDAEAIARSADNERQFRLSIIIGLKADLRAVTPSNELMSNWLRKSLPNGVVPLDILASDNYNKMLSLRATVKSLAW